jgi:hypothetical protein
MLSDDCISILSDMVISSPKGYHNTLKSNKKIASDAGKTEWFNILKLDDIMHIIGEYKCQKI